jgi:hypothetical protein
MVDPFSLGALGALAATEGIKFLYSQAAEVLKRWRAREAGKEAEAQAQIPVASPEVLNGTLTRLTVDFSALDRLHGDIRMLAGVLGNYVGGLEEPDPADPDVVATATTLRNLLEVVYGQRITFKGEERPPSGPVVTGRADIDRVIGDVAGVRARLIRSGRVEGELKAHEVTGRGAGVDADTIG